jgi:hypothetical protein
LFALCVLLFLTSLCYGQFKATDNFNRADGSVGLGWSEWGNGAQISGNQLQTFGGMNVAGGIQRSLDTTFPLKFSFDFSTSSPSDGGYQNGFNAATANVVGSANTSEFAVFQFSGARAVCVFFQTSTGPTSQCAGIVHGQRDYTARAVIVGVVNADFSTKVTIKYNDGMSPVRVTVRVPAPSGVLPTSQGSVLTLGNTNASGGPHVFDTFQLSLM